MIRSETGSWIVPLLLFAAMSAFFAGISTGTFSSYDGKIMLQVTENLVANGGVKTLNDEFGRNSPYASTGIGMSLLMIPAFVAQMFADSSSRFEMIVLTNSALTALTGVVLYSIGRVLGWGRLSLLAPLILAAFTMAMVHTSELFAEPGIGLSLVTILLGMLLWRKGSRWGPILSGLGFASGVLLRTDSLLLCGVMFLALPLFVSPKELWRRRAEVALLGVPVAAAVAWIGLYNWIRWGSPLEWGYEGQGFTTNMSFGLWSLVVSPGKGFFWYNPLLLLALPGMTILLKRDRAVAAAVLLASVARPLFYATWEDFAGGLSWGPRFLLPLCPILAIPAVQLIRSALQSNVLAKVGVVLTGLLLAAVGLAVNVSGIWIRYDQVMRDIATPPPGIAPEKAEPLIKAELNDYYFSFHGNHIARNIDYIREGHPPDNLAWFYPNASPIGVGLLLGSVIGFAGLFLLHNQFQERGGQLLARQAVGAT